jgi:hypothetical protein
LRDINTPERLLMTKQIGETVNVAMEALPEELRTAIVLRELEGLREIEGLSYEEIAVGRCDHGVPDRHGALADFPWHVKRVMVSLDDEPTLLAPGVPAAGLAQRGLVHRLMPLAASVMGVAAVGLVAASLYRQDAPAPQTMPAASTSASRSSMAVRAKSSAVAPRCVAYCPTSAR